MRLEMKWGERVFRWCEEKALDLLVSKRCAEMSMPRRAVFAATILSRNLAVLQQSNRKALESCG
jgi:hypothetical protein